MLKRVLITWFIFFISTIGILLLFSHIGIREPIVLKESILNAILVSCFYLIILRIYMRRSYMTLRNIIYILLGLVIVLVMLQEKGIIEIEMIKLNIEIVVYVVIAIIEGIVAKIQGRNYEEERFWKIEQMMEKELE